LVRLLAVVVVVAGVAGGGLWSLQRRLIYLPDQRLPSIDAVLPGWRSVDLECSDGLTLGGWFRPPSPAAPVAVVFNGNAGNRAGRTTLGARFAAAGFGVLLFDYRGYGGNPGRPTEAGLALDARAAAEFVAQASPGHPVVYFGESLGAAVAIELATVRPPAALILRSPFTSLPDAAAVHYPFLPVGAMLWDQYPSLDRIGGVDAPILIVAGDADGIVPVGQSRRLYQASPEPKDLLIIAGADHNDAELASGAAVIDHVEAFLTAQLDD
jgi:fermentation-respiration switch protein FrsA (DUF1100 family)